MNTEEQIKLFAMSLGLLERDLDKTEQELNLDLQRAMGEVKDEKYYPQFDLSLRQEASQMGSHYELFYCLENSIRSIIAEALAQKGETWWETSIPDDIKINVTANMKKELDSGVTPRSEQEIDYTTFGELGEIVRKNWESFDTIFSSQKAFNRIMTSLNVLRGPIAHCSPLAEDEIVRLQLTVRDWFRLME